MSGEVEDSMSTLQLHNEVKRGSVKRKKGKKSAKKSALPEDNLTIFGMDIDKQVKSAEPTSDEGSGTDSDEDEDQPKKKDAKGPAGKKLQVKVDFKSKVDGALKKKIGRYEW